jgi:ribonuclease HI
MIDREKVVKINNYMVLLGWVQGYIGVPGNQQANAMAKQVAKELLEDAYSKES